MLDKIDVVDYVLLAIMVILILAYAFGAIEASAQETVKEWIMNLLVAFGFKKLPQTIGGNTSSP